MSAPRPDPAHLARLANQCVACGLCLPHCPTYRKTYSEADGPRGRIYMMRAVLEGRMAPSPGFWRHTDRCLGCRRCEAVCPSKVRYGELLEGMRAVTLARRPRTLVARLVGRLALSLLGHPALLAPLGAALRLWLRSGLSRRLRAGALARTALGRAEALLPSALPPAPRPGLYPARGGERGRVALFLGCVARETDGETLHAALALLTALGYTVTVPATQVCCGALHRHAGESGQADALAEANRAAFQGAETVLFAASGCGESLGESLAASGVATAELCAFLAGAAGWEALAFRVPAVPVWLHESCSLANVPKGSEGVRALLERVPGAQVHLLPGNDQCCGGAGTYPLREPGLADALADDKIAAIRASGAATVVTVNPGCALHMGAALRRAGEGGEVLHPVAWLVRHLENRP